MHEESTIREIVDYLTKNGIDEYVKLPQIAVMGDTSSGKSSLLSAISNIQFPASDQLTTRCPTRLCMEQSKNGSYSAKIEVQWHHNSPYKEQPRYESPVLQGKESFADIPRYIAEAQQYIIGVSQKEVAFDVINVRISDPNAFDLTLIDLPGFVRSVGKDESEDIVEDIQTLCREYLGNERCIILAIIPANVDFHNAQIMADALKVDPTTKRTIPVITKPDLIDEGAEKGVFQLLQGKKTHDFKLGFHITKCRGQKALDQGQTVKEGLRSEDAFFSSVDPWRSCSEMRDQFGVTNLKKKLASLQVEMMKETIPAIIEEIKGKKDKAKETLKKLGKDLSTDSDRRDVFSSVIQRFSTLMTGNMAGGKLATWKDDNGFSLRALLEKEKIDFGDNILKSTLYNIDQVPKSSDTVRVLTSKGDVIGTVIDIRQDMYYVDPNETEDADFFYTSQKYEVTRKCEPQTLTTINNSPCKILTCSATTPGKYSITVNQYKSIDKESVEIDHSTWLLEEIQKCRGPDLPAFLNFDLFASIAGKLIADEWKSDANTLLEKMFELIESFTQYAIETSTLGTTVEFTHWMESIINTIIADLKKKTTSQVMNVLECEAEMPYTQNHYLFENISKKRNKRMVNAIKRMANDGKVALDALLALFKANEEMSCDEHIVREMELVLSAYGKVAAKRMIDIIPMKIEREFIATLAKEIQTCFKRTDSQLAGLLKETNAVIHQRNKLIDMIASLEDAERHIEGLLGMH